MTLEKRVLGRTGEEVTVLGFGAMELRGAPRSKDLSGGEVSTLLNAVLDEGINLIDTSIDYGKSEELIGQYLSNRRDEYFLASKCGCTIDLPAGSLPPYPHDYSKTNVRAGLERSLRLLQTDHLDLLQVHMSPSRSTLEHEGTVEVLDELRSEGKTRFIGMSGILPNLVDHIDMGVFDVFQIPYSSIQREHEGLIERASSNDAGIIIRGGVARGAPSQEKAWQGPLGLEPNEGKRRWEGAEIDELIDQMDRMEFMLRYTLSLDALDTTIVGTANIDHLRSNVATAELGPLPEDLYLAARGRLVKAGSVPRQGS